MTGTRDANQAWIDAQRQLLEEIAADATAYADDYFNAPPMGGALGKESDQRAAQQRSIAAAARIASAELAQLSTGHATT